MAAWAPRLQQLAAALAAGLLVVACQPPPPSFVPPPLDYRDRLPIALEVERISVVSAYRPVGELPYVEESIQPTPDAAIRALLDQRLRAVGGPGSIQAVIMDASVTEVLLDTQDGLSGYLTTEAAVRLEGRLRVRVDRLDDTDQVLGTVSTAVTRTRSIPEDAGYAERQRIGSELVMTLVDDLDAGLVFNLQETFHSILRP
jgi:hypothetical protein